MKRIVMLIAATAIVVVGLSVAQAYDLQHVKSVLSGAKECKKCDLTGAVLRGADLTNVDLTGADLTGAELTFAHLNGAKLRGATFKSARLDEVDLSNADLTGANLDKAWCGTSTKLPKGSDWVCVGVVIQHK